MDSSKEIIWSENHKNKSINFNIVSYFINSNTVVISTLLILSIGLYYSSIIPKGDLLIYLNSLNSTFLDFLFKYTTYFGDAILYFPIVILFWFKNKNAILPLILLLVLQTAFVWFLKKIVFTNSLRPRAYLEEINLFEFMHKIEGIRINCYSSFPSGHTLTAFALAFFFIFVYKVDKWLQFIFALCAILAGISRVYLLQHYFIDVVIGGFLGIITAFLISLKYKLNN
ncbi:phosphatase PAP2 family protein [Urechidicola croceus]|uniref:Phosphatidic acid phosphatase type 2/haloperoxidase domain-containing protein n=1 Tax=Urechidicola croceus TaxID=1850246 RepID=A0A1D8P8P0_9FLAO|nr:phosphatase PAP2 family protein [Urechidicola croceus]AOW20947.1 hypothetical protein LPB138_09795 [Urechidicola croceus]